MKSLASKQTLAIAGGTPVRSRFLPFGVPDIREEEIQEVVDTLRSKWIGSGPKVERFESDFRDYQGCKEAVAVSSCTAGLYLSLWSEGIQKGDEVITSDMTFAATANAILATGATPIPIDCCPETFCITPEAIEKKITSRTKAILPVHFAGYPCELEAIESLAQTHGLSLISDSAHAVEARHRGKSLASYGKTSVYSFYANKNITTGEGGMIATDDSLLATKLRKAAIQGLGLNGWQRFRGDRYQHLEVEFPSLKFNMTDIQASLGIHQLARAENNMPIRDQLWARYKKELEGLPIDFPREPNPSDRHARHLFVILLRLHDLRVDRDTVAAAIQAENVGVGVHYLALHRHSSYGFDAKDFPVADDISNRTLSLPFGPGLSEVDTRDVFRAVRKVLTAYST